MEFSGFVPESIKTSFVNVTSYDDKIICGTINNPYFSSEVPFRGLFQLISILDSLQDSMDYPQRTFEMRSFRVAPKPGAASAPGETAARNKIIASFKISIHYRQNASWQGKVDWLDQSESSFFRSTMELMMLLDGALSQTET